MGRVQEHNKEIMHKAEYRAWEMTTYPSPLEERMQLFLEEHFINYELQKIFYIYDEDGWIIRYFIADFYIPDKGIVIEVDGKFHDKQRQHDKVRTKTIQEQYPEIEVLRYKWEDLKDYYKMEELLYKIS